MKKNIETFLLSPAYPFMLSIYPILNLFSTNAYQISYWVLLRPFIFSLLLGVILFMGIRILFREGHKSAFLTTLLLSFTFSYGHIAAFLDTKEVAKIPFLIFLGWAVFTLLLVLITRRYPISYASLTPSINLLAIILLMFPIGKVIQYAVVRKAAFSSQENNIDFVDISTKEPLPDIYYIILDGYGRSDILKEVYDYDNTFFTNGLEDIGFYVAHCSQSNYPNTGLSLASTLNLDYVSNLGKHFTPDERELFYLFSILENNTLTQILEKSGYETITFASGFSVNDNYNYPSTTTRNAHVKSAVSG